MNIVNSEVSSVSPSASCLATIQQQTKGLAEGFPRPQLPTFLAIFSTLCSTQKWSRFHCVPDLMAYFWSMLVSMDRADSMALWTGRGHCCPAFKNAQEWGQSTQGKMPSPTTEGTIWPSRQDCSRHPGKAECCCHTADTCCWGSVVVILPEFDTPLLSPRVSDGEVTSTLVHRLCAMFRAQMLTFHPLTIFRTNTPLWENSGNREI